MELGLGQRYTATVENLTVPTNSGNPFDLWILGANSNVPVIVDRIVCTAGVTSGAIIRVSLLRRTTAGTGGSSVTPKPVNASAPASSSTFSQLVITTQGTGGDLIDSQQWNEFAPYEFNMRPGGVLVPVSGFLALSMPLAPNTTFPASFTVEFIELK